MIKKKDMKKFIFLSVFLATFTTVYSCPVCEKQQPRLLKGISHGNGPQSDWDYLIIFLAIVVVVVTLFFSLKYLLSPGEKNEKHIKRLVLNYD
jgi:hypothetical protein